MLGCKPHNTPMDANVKLLQEGERLCDKKNNIEGLLAYCFTCVLLGQTWFLLLTDLVSLSPILILITWLQCIEF